MRALIFALGVALGCSRKQHLREAPIDVLMLPNAPGAPPMASDASAVLLTAPDVAEPVALADAGRFVIIGAASPAPVSVAPGDDADDDPNPQAHARPHGHRRHRR